MAKKAGFLALGGHIATQNASFRTIMEHLGNGWEFFGLENGFEAFKTGNMYKLSPEVIDPYYAGFYAGATRANLHKKDDDHPDPQKIEEAIKFMRAARLDYLIASAGDDHGMQAETLRKAYKSAGLDCKVLVLSKTMDSDKGGKDGTCIYGYVAPFADTTNGFHTAIKVGTEFINRQYAGSWTNEAVTIVSHFGRDANWVGLALAWYGNCDRIFPGELPKDHPGHSIDTIAELTEQSIAKNQREYGRRFAFIVLPEGTRISGIEHESNLLEDPHNHRKLNPELIAVGLKEILEANYGIKSQNVTITYDMRNSPPSDVDLRLAELTGMKIVCAMRQGATGLEAVIKFRAGEAVAELVPIPLASEKRLASYYPKPLYNPQTFVPLPEIEHYFLPLFGARIERGKLLPRKPTVLNVYEGKN